MARAARGARFCAIQAASLALGLWTIPAAAAGGAAAISVPTHASAGGGGIVVSAYLGSIPSATDLLVDTGAAMCTVDAIEAAALLLRREATHGPDVTAVLASGAQVTEPTIFIAQLHLGAATVSNVQAWVGGEKDIPALGLNVLRAFHTFGFTANTMELGQ